MKIGILTSLNKKPSTFGSKYSIILNSNKIPNSMIRLDDVDMWKEIPLHNQILMAFSHEHREKSFGKDLVYTVENEFNIDCFPSHKEIVHYDEKIFQYWLFKSNNIPTPPTYLFFKYEEAIIGVTEDLLPLVFKLSAGAGSNDVIKISRLKHAHSIIRRMFTTGILAGKIPGDRVNKDLTKRIDAWLRSYYKKYIKREFKHYYQNNVGYAYFQKFLPGNSFDTRVNIIGNRALAFRRFNRKNDFRASGSGLIDHNPSQIDMRCIEIAFDTSRKMGYRNMAYDFLFDVDNNPVVVECTYIYNDFAVYKCPGYWDESCNWNDGNHWPQYLILSDLLKIPLKQPPLHFFNT